MHDILGPGSYEAEEGQEKKCMVVYEQRKGLERVEKVKVGPG